MLKEFIDERRKKLKLGDASPKQDLISCMLGMGNKENEEVLTEKEIVHNAMLVMVSRHDTTSILHTFILRFLANEPAIYAAVPQEQEEITRSKPLGELLTWEDLSKMKYTCKVAMETLRVVPPIFGGFRKALKDIEYGGYLIPKGWQNHQNSTPLEKQAPVPPYCFVAFGSGPWICPGNEFARIETLIAIHHLVTKFTWTLLADNSFRRDPMPVLAQGLPIQIMPRKPL
ncbi:hypothetical protein FEM48_Zijuj01G0228800 [Ziziphus jujuba var. spinosa]|uniref:Uncharacterized protein n=1 Tax=Ziziphus jujuba var. spinosa TaxID=714518 RepID=A0A978W410_ZIZJJ|nr:hypothetical protein FEM48_Zijuj01G0228800 [Ziziphus jujuba var. spinosa]